ncbi:squalene--hopene cyclase, partial [Streptomyces sp. SID11233]|nr:squalene--hopene cyclase [Streptomyces sp. SID11233]
SPFPNRLPFSDFGEVIDPPSADVTAHVVEMLAEEGLAHHPRTRRGVEWLLKNQESDGSWFGRWGVNYV